ncbi:SurA N-terminal domain-containing protein [Priestia endophytica]|uniref:SurA N-terminal domain-containing protein n=1 Tax=Priestia endophytica TaxID=135735 RepID=UPI000F51D5F6|nr:SurA N-terminal domain-containing protein [Priestia endophytica]RPK14892.1 Foldase protein PrsA precursor [Priestia endophytica]
MKKFTYPLIAGLLAVTLTACGSNDDNASDNSKDTKTEQQTSKQDQEKQMKEMQEKLAKQKVDEKKVVATVNGQKILGSDYNMALSTSQSQMQQFGQDPTSKEAAKQIKKQTLDGLVNQELISQDAAKKGYKATDEEIQKELDEVKKPYKTDKEFNKALKEADLNLDDLKAQISDVVQTNKYVEKEIPKGTVTDKQIQDTYDQQVQQLKQSDSKQQQEVPKLEDVKPQIKQSLEEQNQQENLMNKVNELKKDGKVDVKI